MLQVALYSFSASNDQELSFEKGDRLEIVERPAADPEWYRARNGQGLVGLVPRNYLQELSEYLTQPYKLVYLHAYGICIFIYSFLKHLYILSYNCVQI